MKVVYLNKYCVRCYQYIVENEGRLINICNNDMCKSYKILRSTLPFIEANSEGQSFIYCEGYHEEHPGEYILVYDRLINNDENQKRLLNILKYLGYQNISFLVKRETVDDTLENVGVKLAEMNLEFSSISTDIIDIKSEVSETKAIRNELIEIKKEFSAFDTKISELESKVDKITEILGDMMNIFRNING